MFQSLLLNSLDQKVSIDKIKSYLPNVSRFSIISYETESIIYHVLNPMERNVSGIKFKHIEGKCFTQHN